MKSLNEIDYKALAAERNGNYFPSPMAWEDLVFYFLLVDRFSDTRENKLFTNADFGNAIENDTDAAIWRYAGSTWCGGTLSGIISKLDYIKKLGISAIWISPIFKQVEKLDTYHGYGIQDFLEIDHRFGTKADLLELVKLAHLKGIYIVLDVILNHSANVWDYNPDRYRTLDPNSNQWYMEPRWDGNNYTVKGFYDKDRQITQQINSRDDGVWPAEFQNLFEIFTRKGLIKNWDYDPEYKEGDFFDLKDINLGNDNLDNFLPSNGLLHLCEVYKYWIAYADIDGFRIDTVKHMGNAATRFFCREIKEFTQSIGKNNFYLIGEVAGGRENAFYTVEITGLNAALGIDDIQDKLEYITKGFRNPEDYFDLFSNSKELGKESHTWFNDKVITMIDDHDQIRKRDSKARFCATQNGDKLIYAALALNLMTLGIPCIYYGTEQYFDGQGNSDKYIRECMFGGEFGAFRSKHVHFFDEDGLLYKNIGILIALRQNHIELHRGRQYLRQISGDGINFNYPSIIGEKLVSLIAWSRIFNNNELVCAINNSLDTELFAWVCIDNRLNATGDQFTCIFSSDISTQTIKSSAVEAKNGKALRISVPPAGFAVFEKNNK
jgi:glycosidase